MFDGMIFEGRHENPGAYKYRVDHALCVRCGIRLTDSDKAKSDNLRCKSCRAAVNRRYKENMAVKPKDHKQEEISRDEMERRRRAAGLCLMCGKILIKPADKHRGYCEDCADKHDEMVEARIAEAVKRDKQRQAEKSGREESVVRVVNTFEWFRKTIFNMASDGTYNECVNCVWRRQRTENEKNSYCPTPSGTSPKFRNCLKFDVTTGHCKRVIRVKKNEEGKD